MPAAFVDRREELEQLRRAASTPPTLSILRGRRRIGKSFLMDEALSRSRLVSFQADEQDEAGQLASLAREAARVLPGAPPLALPDWDAAFDFFTTQAEVEPLVVVLDEFQYLCRSQPALPSIVQRRWDDWQRRNVEVALVLSGSAISFMEGLLAETAPLFGRATYVPLLGPLTYRDCAAFARSDSSARTLVARFGVLGGTPQYQVWAGARGLEATIRETVLAKGSPLYEEPLNLLRSEQGVREPATYFSVLRAIAAGRTRPGEIANLIGTDPSATSKLLDRLQTLGYVEEQAPLGTGRQPARTVWRIADPFFRFWFRYVAPNRSRLDRGRIDAVYKEIEADLDTYLGHVFEDCCRTWVGRYASLPEATRSTAIGSWWSRTGDAEIDVVGVDKRAVRVVGSCKWRERIREDVLDELYEQRARLGGTAARARLVIFGGGRFDAHLRERAEREGVVLVSADELFTHARP